MRKLFLKALAKINLGLDVLGRRENGYHDVRMVMQSVYLYDEVAVEARTEQGISLRTNLSFLPTGEANIAYKAAAMLKGGTPRRGRSVLHHAGDGAGGGDWRKAHTPPGDA